MSDPIRVEDFLKKLNLVKPALAKGETLPIFTSFCFADGRVLAYDDVVAIETELASEIEGAVLGKPLLEFLAKVGEEFVEPNPSSDFLGLKAGKIKCQLPLMGKDSFAFEMPTEGFNFAIEPYHAGKDMGFSEGLSYSLIVSNANAVTPAAAGVTLSLGKNSSLLATDNLSVSRYDLDYEAPDFHTGTYILPDKFCRIVDSVSKQYNYTKNLTLGIADEFVMMEIEDVGTIFSKLIPNKAIDYNAIFSVVEDPLDDSDYYPLPEGFKAVLGRLEIFTGKSGLATMEATSNELKFHVFSKYGEFEESIPLKGTQPPIIVKFNPHLISRVLEYATHMHVTDKAIILKGQCRTYMLSVQE